MMKMNKVLVKLYVPLLDEQYDVWLPLNRKIYKITEFLVKAVSDFHGGNYSYNRKPILYSRLTAEPYNINLSVKESGIKNSTEIVLI